MQQNLSLCCVLAAALNLQLNAAPETTVLIDEDFSSLSAPWQDLSLAVDWGNGATPDSAFEIQNGVLQLNPVINGWTSYTSTAGLRTFTAIDFQFPSAIDHSSNVLVIDFRARWNTYAGSKAENNRFLVTVQTDYPVGGLDLETPSLITDPSGHPWARPAYQIRMRGAPDSVLDADGGGSTILQYGGGDDPLGEYEYLNDFGWWVPGFNSSALGNASHSSGSVSAPGEYSFGGPFPFNSWINTPTGLASTDWQRFRFVIYPDRMELWRDSIGDGAFQLEQSLILPETDMAPQVAREWGYYHYFRSLEGVRLYWRASSLTNLRDQVYIDDVHIESTEYGSHYHYWLHQFFAAGEVATFGEDLGNLAPAADFNNDGIPNDIAYAAGRDPRQMTSLADLLRLQLMEDSLVVTYPQSWYAYDADLVLESSTDLLTWHTDQITEIRMEDDIDPASPTADVDNRDTWYDRPEVQSGTWTVQATIPLQPDTPLFVRLRTQ